jgi:hypothetical protein
MIILLYVGVVGLVYILLVCWFFFGACEIVSHNSISCKIYISGNLVLVFVSVQLWFVLQFIILSAAKFALLPDYFTLRMSVIENLVKHVQFAARI